MKDNPLILIVDDDATARETLEALLYPEGYQLKLAAGGAEALACLELCPLDAILLDVMMPEIDGFELCRQIKADNRWSHIPIILVTALDSKQDIVRGLDAGADEFLSKPVNSLELRARVRSMLRIKKQHDEMAALMQLREDLVNMIVHDIRNPLTSIVGFSGFLLSREDWPANYRSDLEAVSRQAQYLQAFTHDLLAMAKMERGKLLLNRFLVDVSQLIMETMDALQVVAESRRIVLATNGSQHQSLLAFLDAALFRRVVDNLVANALKFSPTGSVITVHWKNLDAQSVLSTEARVQLKVTDQGPGIASEDRERIFDKFETVRLKQKGVTQVGLGLAFCKLVVETHGGRIWVEPNQPQGSTFIVEI